MPIISLSALILVTLLGTSSCASLPLGSKTSVEQVLRESEPLSQQLDAEWLEEQEARDAERGIGSVAPAEIFPKFQIPLRAMRVNSKFGVRTGRPHAGMDLRARTGTPFYASAKGIVVYAGYGIHGYGNTVIVRHAGNYATLYAHAESLRVIAGEKIERGHCLGYAGETGNASAPHLHFEIRKGTKPIDPAPILFPPPASRS